MTHAHLSSGDANADALATAVMIMPRMAQSTGVKLSATSGSPYENRKTPLMAPTQMPYGPFRLSSQPGNGSAKVLMTRRQADHPPVRTSSSLHAQLTWVSIST